MGIWPRPVRRVSIRDSSDSAIIGVANLAFLGETERSQNDDERMQMDSERNQLRKTMRGRRSTEAKYEVYNLTILMY
jgi:hypothetical protein